MSERGQRGKEAEKEVEALLRQWNTRGDFAWHRFPDSRAARGVIAAQPSDVLIVVNGTTIFLETKETAHDSRVAKDKVSQLPMLYKFFYAGATCLVLVKHTKLKRWRIVYATNLPIGLPSWDLSEFPLFETAQDALTSTGLF